MLYFFYVLISLILFMMGAVVFSYLNIVIQGLPVKDNLLKKHSECELCGHEQKFVDVVPIFSQIRFKGKCRYCGGSLKKRPLLIELMGGFLMLLCAAFYGISLQTFFVFIVLCDLTVITFIDADTQEIPPVLNIILLALGIASIWILDGPDIVERLIGVFAVSTPMFLLAVLLNGFGGGDVKLMAAAGFLLGWKGVVAAFFIGVLGGGAYGAYLLITKKKDRKGYFAFGPFLCMGILIALINNFGDYLIQLYINYIMSFKNIEQMIMY